jgi:hypothetical protein
LGSTVVLAGGSTDTAHLADTWQLNGQGTDGTGCVLNSDCNSGACSDGVCCNSSCGASDPHDCQACSLATGATVDGVCTILSTANTCRASAGRCDAPETCSGAVAWCPSDAKLAAGSTCRAIAGACDVAEVCDGMSNACPSDGFAARTTSCASLSCGTSTCTGLQADCRDTCTDAVDGDGGVDAGAANGGVDSEDGDAGAADGGVDASIEGPGETNSGDDNVDAGTAGESGPDGHVAGCGCATNDVWFACGVLLLLRNRKPRQVPTDAVRALD